jgi:hypothetical protein
LHPGHFLHPRDERSIHRRGQKVHKKRYNPDCTRSLPQVE